MGQRASEMMAIRTSGLSKQFGERHAVTNLDLAVVAVPDSRKGNRLVLCGDKQADVDQIRKHYNQECHPVERIDELCLLEQIPRSPLGKVLYGALAEAVVEQRVS